MILGAKPDRGKPRFIRSETKLKHTGVNPGTLATQPPDENNILGLNRHALDKVRDLEEPNGQAMPKLDTPHLGLVPLNPPNFAAKGHAWVYISYLSHSSSLDRTERRESRAVERKMWDSGSHVRCGRRAITRSRGTASAWAAFENADR